MRDNGRMIKNELGTSSTSSDIHRIPCFLIGEGEKIHSYYNFFPSISYNKSLRFSSFSNSISIWDSNVYIKCFVTFLFVCCLCRQDSFEWEKDWIETKKKFANVYFGVDGPFQHFYIPVGFFCQINVAFPTIINISKY